MSGRGLSLSGTAVHEVRAGDTVRVAIRPHDLVVVEPGQSVQGRNTLDGLVTVVEYQGREFAVGVTTSAGQSLFVTAERAPQPGDRVTLAVDPARALIYQADLTQEDASRPAEPVAVQ